MVAKFSKQGIQPDPREVDYWIDISTDPYGSIIKYFNGDSWVDLVADAETKLNNEVNTLKNTTSTLTSNLSAETSRATAAEETLQANINTAVSNINITLEDNYYTGQTVDNKIESAITAHDEDRLAHEPIRNSISEVSNVANEAKTLSSLAINTASESTQVAEEARTVSYDFAQVAQEAMNTADAAKNAVATLEGLTDVDTSALTTAELIAKVEQNTIDVKALKERDVLIPQSEFDALTEKDVTKHYLIYEDPIQV